jgi:hypothetical protein
MPPSIGGIDYKHKNDNRAESLTLNHADGRRARLAQRRVQSRAPGPALRSPTSWSRTFFAAAWWWCSRLPRTVVGYGSAVDRDEVALETFLDATIERAYVDMVLPGGFVDLVVVAAGETMHLLAAGLRLPTADRWNHAVSYEDCQRWLVGAQITGAVQARRPWGLTLTLDNGESISSISL